MARALVAEASSPLASALARFVTAAGHAVTFATTPEEAVGQLSGQEPPELVLAATVGFPGEALCTRIKSSQPRTLVLLSFGPDDESAGQRAQAAGADAYFLLPPRAHQVQALVGLAAQLLEARKAFAAQAGKQRADSEFFKKYMVHEVKRSVRYQMPVSLLLAGVDGLSASRPPQEKSLLRAEVVGALAQLLRDIDIVVATGGDRYLVFLPNTGRDGALKVAARVQTRLARLVAVPGAKSSVGVSTYEPQGAPRRVTFGKMLAQATALLRAVQEKGGGKIGVGARRARA